jgi:hypothetical protein
LLLPVTVHLHVLETQLRLAVLEIVFQCTRRVLGVELQRQVVAVEE